MRNAVEQITLTLGRQKHAPVSAGGPVSDLVQVLVPWVEEDGVTLMLVLS